MSDDFELNSEWETSSGLPLADADVTVVACSFGFNANLGADRLCANFTFAPLEGGELIEQSFTVGKGWEAKNKGAQLVNEDGTPRKVSNRTNFGRLIDSAVAAVKASGATVMPFESAKNADGWVGTNWHMDTVEVDTLNKKNEQVKGEAFIFTAFLGGSPTDEAPAAAKGTSKPAAAKGGIDPKLRLALVELAEAADDHDAFTEKALELDGVEGNREAEKLVLKTGPGSIWHEVKEAA